MYCGVNASFASQPLAHALALALKSNQEARNRGTVAAGVSPATEDKIDIPARTATAHLESATIHFQSV
jgi:hypothetical protein